jgi:hypothetical protein
MPIVPPSGTSSPATRSLSSESGSLSYYAHGASVPPSLTATPSRPGTRHSHTRRLDPGPPQQADRHGESLRLSGPISESIDPEVAPAAYYHIECVLAMSALSTKRALLVFNFEVDPGDDEAAFVGTVERNNPNNPTPPQERRYLIPLFRSASVTATIRGEEDAFSRASGSASTAMTTPSTPALSSASFKSSRHGHGERRRGSALLPTRSHEHGKAHSPLTRSPPASALVASATASTPPPLTSCQCPPEGTGGRRCNARAESPSSEFARGGSPRRPKGGVAGSISSAMHGHAAGTGPTRPTRSGISGSRHSLQFPPPTADPTANVARALIEKLMGSAARPTVGPAVTTSRSTADKTLAASFVQRAWLLSNGVFAPGTVFVLDHELLKGWCKNILSKRLQVRPPPRRS